MFVFLFRRNRELARQLALYLAGGKQVLNAFRDGVAHYLQHGPRGLDVHSRAAHAHESECDRIRRQIERDLFAKSLLPESREDIMALIEHMDPVLNQAEDVLRQILLQHIVLPEPFRPGYAELARLSHEAGTTLCDQADAALRSAPGARALGDAVKACESRADQTEQRLVAELFDSGLPLAEKLHYRDLITMTAAISDLAEDAANLLTVFALKREA